jgi:hypothetical protein
MTSSGAKAALQTFILRRIAPGGEKLKGLSKVTKLTNFERHFSTAPNLILVSRKRMGCERKIAAL